MLNFSLFNCFVQPSEQNESMQPYWLGFFFSEDIKPVDRYLTL